MAREKCGHLDVARTIYQLTLIYALPCVGCHVTEFLLTVARSQEHSSVMCSASNPKDNKLHECECFVVQFNGFISLTSYFDVKYRF